MKKAWKTFKDDPIFYLIIFGFFILLGYLIVCRWILGFKEWLPGTGFSSKNLWHWLNLLGAPLILAFIIWRFEIAQKKRELLVTAEEHQKDLDIDREKYRLDNELFKNTVLRESLDSINVLIESHNFSLGAVGGYTEKVARAKIISALMTLDSAKNKIFLDFLQSIQAVVSMSGTKLDHVALRECDLSGFDFSDSDLVGARFTQSKLTNTKFNRSDLSGADFFNSKCDHPIFSGATLTGAEFTYAVLSHADFSNAKLQSASFQDADLSNANFSGAETDDSTEWVGAIFHNTTMPDGQIRNQ